VRIPLIVTKYKSSTSYILSFVSVKWFFSFEFTKRSTLTERISANYANFYKFSFLKQVQDNVLSKLALIKVNLDQKMGKSLSEDLRWRIIYCQADGFTQKEIAKRMYVSEATVNKVCRIFKKWGCVKDPFVVRVGRRKIFTTQDMLVRTSNNCFLLHDI